MANIYNFEDSSRFGKQGEAIVYEILKQDKNVKYIWDVRDELLYRKNDIDFCIEYLNGRKTTIEIKTDSYTSGNFYYEVKSNLVIDVKGCMDKTKAELLYYYYPNMNLLYIFEIQKLRNFMAIALPWFDLKGYKKTVRTKSPQSFRLDESISVGYAIPLSIFETMSPTWMQKQHVPKAQDILEYMKQKELQQGIS